ncbi:hypothetical protein EDE04_6725 [Streptomyces sp. 2132.2]|uniref:hypothetical protein n=1 Tax=Streptomyces TaxID=1883 RepID=UPI000C1905EE|nr:hypothetical protein [Streptomyces sp. 2132.2]ROR00167.1 hypothetical protein EDE04_6725 [Streptomyces sp. 2132.2]
MIRRGAAAAAAAALAMAAAVAGAAAPAQAAAPVCEGTKIDTLDFATGYTYLYYSSATGRNCAYTVPKSGTGTPQLIAVGLFRASDNQGAWDSRADYKYYAGPVYLDARGTCVLFNGQVRSTSASSGWGHCGALTAGAR